MPADSHLPPELTSFVGRAEELAAIGEAVTAGRVLTLVGPGGCGKTRLAIRVCQTAAEAWRDGAYWVGLEEEADGAHVARRMAAALDVLLPAGPDPVPALVSALRDRELLVVVDNCEHVLDDAARVIAAVLAKCPGVAVLATSRSTLGIAGERVWRVPPMVLADALELFLERVSAGAPDAAGRAEARSGARRICDRLDRMPLALELAAGWAGALSLTQSPTPWARRSLCWRAGRARRPSGSGRCRGRCAGATTCWTTTSGCCSAVSGSSSRASPPTTSPTWAPSVGLTATTC